MEGTLNRQNAELAALKMLGLLRSALVSDLLVLESSSIGNHGQQATAALEQKLRLASEMQFANDLAATLAERDAKLVEIEREALIRAKLLDEASQASASLESENLLLGKLLEEASAAAAAFEKENATLARLLDEASSAASAFEKENATLGRLLDDASGAAARFEKEIGYLSNVLEVNRLAMAEYASRAETAEKELLALQAERRAGFGGDTEPTHARGVVREDQPLCLLGDGWHALESIGAESFRWVGAAAQVNIAQLTWAPYELLIEAEPGPGVGNEPFDLVVLENGVRIAALNFEGRQARVFELETGEPRVRTLTLVAEGGGAPVPVPGDSRILNYRVFRVTLQRRVGDVVALGSGLRPGQGWYRLEEQDGETFRWAGAEVVIEALSGVRVDTVVLDLEPGPGVGVEPLKLHVLDGDTPDSVIVLTKRERVRLAWPSSAGSSLKLRVDGGGRLIPSDPRVLNFRAFGTVD